MRVDLVERLGVAHVEGRQQDTGAVMHVLPSEQEQRPHGGSSRHTVPSAMGCEAVGLRAYLLDEVSDVATEEADIGLPCLRHNT